MNPAIACTISGRFPALVARQSEAGRPGRAAVNIQALFPSPPNCRMRGDGKCSFNQCSLTAASTIRRPMAPDPHLRQRALQPFRVNW